MREHDDTNAATCAYNDLVLIKIVPSQVGNVNPRVPFWSGPDGLAPGIVATGGTVYSYGNSVLRGGVRALSPKAGASLGKTEEAKVGARRSTRSRRAFPATRAARR